MSFLNLANGKVDSPAAMKSATELNRLRATDTGGEGCHEDDAHIKASFLKVNKSNFDNLAKRLLGALDPFCPVDTRQDLPTAMPRQIGHEPHHAARHRLGRLDLIIFQQP